MAGAELRRDRRVIARTLVDVVDLHRDRRAGGQAVEHAGQDADLVGLLALGGEARLTGAAAVEPGLDVGLRQRDARRAAIDHTANGGPVALAPGGDTEQVAEAVVRHAVSPSIRTHHAIKSAANHQAPGCGRNAVPRQRSA